MTGVRDGAVHRVLPSHQSGTRHFGFLLFVYTHLLPQKQCSGLPQDWLTFLVVCSFLFIHLFFSCIDYLPGPLEKGKSTRADAKPAFRSKTSGMPNRDKPNVKPVTGHISLRVTLSGLDPWPLISHVQKTSDECPGPKGERPIPRPCLCPVLFGRKKATRFPSHNH